MTFARLRWLLLRPLWCGHYHTAWELDDHGHQQLRCLDCWKKVWP